MLNLSKNKQNDESGNPDRTELGELYPSPKTYEDRAKEQEDREARRLQRIPHHFALFVAGRLFILILVSVLIYVLSPILVSWMFNFVLCVLILLGLVKLLSGEISAAFDKKGLNSTTFYTLYLIIIAPLTALALYNANTQSHVSSTVLIYLFTFLLHYAAIKFIIALMVRAQSHQ